MNAVVRCAAPVREPETTAPFEGNALAAQREALAADRPHVCFVAPQCWPILARDEHLPVVGGAEVQQCIIARGLARAGYRVSMICLDYGQPEYVVIDGIAVVKTHKPGAGLPVLRFVTPRLTSWWRAMKAVDADIYYQRSSAVLTALVAVFTRRSGKRSIYAAASDVDFRPGREVIRLGRDRWLYRKGVANVDRIVVQNRVQQQECLDVFHRDSTYIPSGYEVPETSRERVAEARAGGGGDTVLWVANMREAKRPMRFLDIAERLPQRRFVLVGGAGGEDPSQGRHFEAVKARAASLPNVTLAGFLPVHRVEPYFDAARVVVNTSDYEGMPNTFLQAWARGVPTLAFIDVGARLAGAPLYPVVTTVDEAAAEIERLFTDADHRARASERSLAYFEGKHSVRHVVGCYARLLDALHGNAA